MKKVLFAITTLLTLLAIKAAWVTGVRNLSELAAFNPLNLHSNVFVAGTSTPGDGGGGIYIYRTTSAVTNEDGSIVASTYSTGFWHRVVPNTITITNGNGDGATYVTTYITTNINQFLTTNSITSITNLYQNITNITIQNIVANNLSRPSCVVTGATPLINWTNCFLDNLVLSTNTAPIMVGVPIGTNVPTHEVDVVQPLGAAYTLTWGDDIYWPNGTNSLVLPEDSTNKFVFQWNGESLRGWLVDGAASSGISGLTAGYLTVATGPTSIGNSPISLVTTNVMSFQGNDASDLSFLLLGANTNTSTAFFGAYLADSDGQGQVVQINAVKIGGWDVGTPATRDGLFSVNVMHTNSLSQMMELRGDNGNFTVLDNTGSFVNFFVNGASGYAGNGTRFLSDNGTYKFPFWQSNGTNLWPNPDIYTIGFTNTGPETVPAFIIDTTDIFTDIGTNVFQVKTQGYEIFSAGPAIEGFGIYVGPYTGFGQGEIVTHNNHATLNLYSRNDESASISLRSGEGYTNEGLGIKDTNGVNTVQFYPRAVNTATAHLLNTIAARTSGAVLDVQDDDVSQFKIDHSTTGGDTRMLLYDVDNATLERVTVGIADSGGAGFKLLRIPN